MGMLAVPGRAQGFARVSPWQAPLALSPAAPGGRSAPEFQPLLENQQTPLWGGQTHWGPCCRRPSALESWPLGHSPQQMPLAKLHQDVLTVLNKTARLPQA